ncbi:MAG: hypothetical protein HC834_03825, partial [Rhodospirillales bacterium]|nr:hypothetical protein [Rhodospirillales bacterium]
MADVLYNTGLANYIGSGSGQLVVDTATLITLAKADLSGSALNLLFNTGRQVVITSTVRDEATANMSFADAQTISNWIIANTGSGTQPARLVVDDSLSNPIPGSVPNAGEQSIIGYVNRNSGIADIRVISEDLSWMEGSNNLPAGRDLAGTSGVNLTTNEFINDLLLSGSITPLDYATSAGQVLGTGRSNAEQAALLLVPGSEVQLVDQAGHVNTFLFLGLGAVLSNPDGLPLQIVPPSGTLNIPQSQGPLLPDNRTDADPVGNFLNLDYAIMTNYGAGLITVSAYESYTDLEHYPIRLHHNLRLRSSWYTRQARRDRRGCRSSPTGRRWFARR